MKPRHFFSAIRKWWWLLIIATAVTAGSSYYAVLQMPRIYEAYTSVIVGQGLQSSNPDSQDLYISQQLAQTYREMVTREPILRGAAESLGLPYWPRAEDVTAWLVPNTQLMGIAVKDTDPERARALADAIAQQLILRTPNEIAEDQARQDFVRSQLRQLEVSIQTTEEEILTEQVELDTASSAWAIQQYQDNIAALEQKLASYQANYGSLLGSVEGRTNYLSVFEPATTPTVPISPKMVQTVLLASAMGLALALGGALLIELLDDTVKTADDIGQVVDLPVLGTVSHFKGVRRHDPQNPITAREPLSLSAEAYRTVRTNLRASSVDKPVRTLVVTSPSDSEGKTTLVSNLGIVMAQAGSRVRLIDADLRRSSLHKALDMKNQEGLTSVLLEEDQVLDSLLRETELENLKVLTSGPLPINPSELLGSEKMRQLVESMKDKADIVIFDTPPHLVVTDASVLAMEADAVLLVAKAGRTRRAALQRTEEQFRQLGVRIVGVVLNDVRVRRSSRYYYDYRPEPEVEKEAEDE